MSIIRSCSNLCHHFSNSLETVTAEALAKKPTCKRLGNNVSGGKLIIVNRKNSSMKADMNKKSQFVFTLLIRLAKL